MVPTEMALACARSVFTNVIMHDIAAGEIPDASAEVVVDGTQFVAALTYGGQQRVFLPLKLWTWRR